MAPTHPRVLTAPASHEVGGTSLTLSGRNMKWFLGQALWPDQESGVSFWVASMLYADEGHVRDSCVWIPQYGQALGRSQLRGHCIGPRSPSPVTYLSSPKEKTTYYKLTWAEETRVPNRGDKISTKTKQMDSQIKTLYNNYPFQQQPVTIKKRVNWKATSRLGCNIL